MSAWNESGWNEIPWNGPNAPDTIPTAPVIYGTLWNQKKWNTATWAGPLELPTGAQADLCPYLGARYGQDGYNTRVYCGILHDEPMAHACAEGEIVAEVVVEVDLSC